MPKSNYLQNLARARQAGGIPAAVSQVVTQAVGKNNAFDPTLGYPGAIDYDLYAGQQSAASFQADHLKGMDRAILRVGQGGIGIDPQFKNSQTCARGIVPRDFYWYLDVWQSDAGQARDCAGAIGEDFDEDSVLYADFEDDHSTGSRKAGNYQHLDWGHLKSFLDDFAAIQPKLKLGIYTALSFWHDHGTTAQVAAQYPLWIAWPVYPYQTPPPLAPWGVNWKMHQFSFIGQGYGGVDLNYIRTGA